MLKKDGPLVVALWAIVFALLLNASVSFADAPQQHSPNQTQTQSNHVRPAQKPKDISFWQRTMDDPINLFTAVLAVFTIVLAGASIWQGTLTRRSIDLARDELNLTHRPTLQVRFVREVAEGAEITVINEGTGGARFIEGRAVVTAVDEPDAIPAPHEIPAKGGFHLRAIFDPSDSDRFVVTETPDENGDGWFGENIYVFGWIVYETIAPTPSRRTTYFGRKVRDDGGVDPVTIAVSGSDWNFVQ